MISDTGSIKQDVAKCVESKRANVITKFDFALAYQYKIKGIEHSTTALTYGCETWENQIVPSIEIIHRSGIIYTLSIRPTINNELIHIDSGCFPLFISIRKLQLKFWTNIYQIAQESPDNPIRKLLNLGENLGVSCIKYYRDLEERYITPINCYNTLKSEF